MAVWSYAPQEVLTETWNTAVRVNQVSQRQEVMGSDALVMLEQWRLRYSIVDSVTVGSMVAFYTAQQGGFLAFQWFTPNAQALRTVRFDGNLSVDLFLTNLLRTGEVVFQAVVNS